MVKIKRLPSGSYSASVFDYRDDNGKRHYKQFTADTKQEVSYAVAAFQLKKDNRKHVLRVTVGEAIEQYIELKRPILSPSTIQGYEKIKRNTMQQLQLVPLKDLTSESIQKSINREAERLSPKSLRNAYGLLKAVLKKYHPDFSYAVDFPAKQKKITELLAPEDIIRCIKGTEVELPVLLAMWLSLRMSEIRGLRYEDIQEDGSIVIRNTILDVNGTAVERHNTKTINSTRRLKLPGYIRALIHAQGKTAGYIVSLSGQAIYKRFVRLLEQNHLPHMRFHDLRHINASVMVMLGVPNKYAMERGGWATDEVLKNIYQHTYSSEREAVDRKIDRYFEHIMQDEMQDKMQDGT